MSQMTNYSFGTFVYADRPQTPEDVYARIAETFDALKTQHAGTSRPSYAAAGIIWHDNANGTWNMWDGSTDTPIPRKVSVPTTSADDGQPGDWAADGAYLYVYVGDGVTHVWLRIAGVSSW